MNTEHCHVTTNLGLPLLAKSIHGRAERDKDHCTAVPNLININYDSRVVIWGIFKSGTTLES